MRKALNISNPIYLSSELKLSFGTTERIVDMVKKTGCTKYLSGESGKNYLDEELFKEAGIQLIYSEFKHPTYHQQFGEFIPNLSVIDLLFNEGVRAMDFVTATI